MDIVRFGVIKVGDAWTVVCDGGDRLSFVSRDRAVTAVRELMAVQKGFGHRVELLSQNELFELKSDVDVH